MKNETITSLILFIIIVTILSFTLCVEDSIINYYIFLSIPVLCAMAILKAIKGKRNV